MITKLRFPAAGVRALAAHANAATGVRVLSLDQRFQEAYRLDQNAPIGPHGLTNDQVNWSTIPPHLHFAKDDGIMLTSDGLPAMAESDPYRVVYANGFRPGVSHQDMDEAVGSDDLVMAIPVAEFPHLDNPAITAYVITLTETHYYIAGETRATLAARPAPASSSS
jgi:hypothetical protein